MEHDEAKRARFAERYVARELPPTEVDAFEEHYFQCRECAEEVRLEQTFAANVREASRRERVTERQPGFWTSLTGWFAVHPGLTLSLAANALLLLGLGYLLSVRPSVSGDQARFMPAYFAAPPARSLDDPQAIPPGTSSFLVHFPAPDTGSSSYSYEIVGPNGNREAYGTFAPPPARDFGLEVSIQRLGAGIHTLTIRDQSGKETVARFRFRTSA
ncbi:MAG: zf-HC2 domain-containing protein [Bryobacteraceae bacterium]